MKDFINLLTPELFEEAEAIPFRRFLVYPTLLLVVLAIFLTMSGIRGAQVRRFNHQVTALKAERDRLRTGVMSLMGLVEMRRDKDTGALRALPVGRVRWSEVLRVLSFLTPDGVRLTSMVSEQDRGVRLAGIASSYGGAVRFLSTLELSGEFEGLRLLRATAEEGRVVFEITGRVRLLSGPSSPSAVS